MLLVLAVAFPALALSGPAPKMNQATTQVSEGLFKIDDFESGSLKSPRDWWTFDISKVEVVANDNYKGGDSKVAAETGKYSLHLQGQAKNWYVGGCGVYMAMENQDLSKYNTLDIDVFGNGEGSGTMKIELYDDDNANWAIEQDAKRNYVPIYDDKLVYDIKIDWNGWKRLSIPLADFVDDNPGVGDDIWNPQQTGGSGGLLQMQLICLGSTDKATVNLNVDNIVLTSGEKR
jgi:hypothetical protein